MDPESELEESMEALEAPSELELKLDDAPLQLLKLPPLRSNSRKVLMRSRASITVISEVANAELSVELLEGDLLEAFPIPLPQGETVRQLRSTGAILGQLSVPGVPPVPFGVQVEVTAQCRSNVQLNGFGGHGSPATELRSLRVEDADGGHGCRGVEGWQWFGCSW